MIICITFGKNYRKEVFKMNADRATKIMRVIIRVLRGIIRFIGNGK